MKKIDKEHIEHPAKGVVGMTDFLLENNFKVGLRRVPDEHTSRIQEALTEHFGRSQVYQALSAERAQD